MTLLDLSHSYADLDGFGIPWTPMEVPAPAFVRVNEALAAQLGLDPAALYSAEALAVFAGAATPDGALPIAQAYAGHQFGGFNPRLGDGRSVLLGEITAPDGQRLDVALKGSGRTPFARGGDGKSALGPVLREYLMSEAMHVLGVPTTRALAAVTTGELVRREGMLPGAVLTRVAASHLRVGTFQFFASRQDTERLQVLLDFAIERHDPNLRGADNQALALLDSVITRQSTLIAQWMSLGFIHGVMNTDNVTISGETIDYGPCAFMDAYDPATVFSSIDHGGRYAYGNQPNIGHWNMARLAEALVPLIDDDQDRAVELATETLHTYPDRFEAAWLDYMRAKLGIGHPQDDDIELVNDLLKLLEAGRADYTTAFRRLSEAADGSLSSRVGITSMFEAPATDWLDRWAARRSPDAQRVMMQTNPIYVPRNHLVEAAIESGVAGDMTAFDELSAVLRAPFEPRDGMERYEQPAPEGFSDSYRTFCGT